MPLINLIKEQRLEAKKKEQGVQIAIMATLGIGALALLATAGLLLDSARLNLQAGALEAKLEEMKPIVEQLEANNAEIEKLQPRLDTLETAQKDSATWVHILEHLTVNTPEATWLNTFKSFQQDRTQPLVITFNGLSQSQEAVGEFLLRLEASDDLENVTLKYTQPKFSDSGKHLEFELVADMVGTKEETSTAKEKQSP